MILENCTTCIYWKWYFINFSVWIEHIYMQHEINTIDVKQLCDE